MNPLLLLAVLGGFFVLNKKSKSKSSSVTPPKSCEYLCLPGNVLNVFQYLITIPQEFQKLIVGQGLTDPYDIAKKIPYFQYCGLKDVKPDSPIMLRDIYESSVRISALYVFYFGKSTKEKVTRFLMDDYAKLLVYLKMMTPGKLDEYTKKWIDNLTEQEAKAEVQDLLKKFPILGDVQNDVLATAIVINKCMRFDLDLMEQTKCFKTKNMQFDDYRSKDMKPVFEIYKKAIYSLKG